MDKIRRGSDLRKEKWGSPSIQESKIAAMLSKRSSIHTVTNCVTFPRRPGSTTIPWCHMLLRSILLENVCASMPCLLPSWSEMHDECVTCAKKCAVAMGANVLKGCLLFVLEVERNFKTRNIMRFYAWFQFIVTAPVARKSAIWPIMIAHTPFRANEWLYRNCSMK